jgi:hypothetical protein
MWSAASSGPSVSRARSPGRPRQFEVDDVLDRAIEVFRERGYEASITETAWPRRARAVAIEQPITPALTMNASSVLPPTDR